MDLLVESDIELLNYIWFKSLILREGFKYLKIWIQSIYESYVL